MTPREIELHFCGALLSSSGKEQKVGDMKFEGGKIIENSPTNHVILISDVT